MQIPIEAITTTLQKLPYAYVFLVALGAGVVHLVVKQKQVNRANVKMTIIVFLILATLIIILDLFVKPFILGYK